jgi:hypothetical protein
MKRGKIVTHYDILPPEPIYEQHISHCYWHDSLHLNTDSILNAVAGLDGDEFFGVRSRRIIQ